MSDGFNGDLEAEAILARLSVLAGGRILEAQPDDDNLPRDDSGRVRPYAVVYFSDPVPAAGDRTFDRDGAQPFVLPVMIQWSAPDPATLRALASAGRSLLVDWRPSLAADAMQPIGGGSYTTLDAQNKPSRYNRLAHFSTTINLSGASVS